MFHGNGLLRVITRTSTTNEGIYTILREFARASIHSAMSDFPVLDMDKLKADMAECVERTSARAFSKAATGGKNADFYRNFVNDGQNKRLSADVFIGITYALGKDPSEYIVGFDHTVQLPNATVLTSTFALLLDSVGVDPYEDARAQKLAAQFPNALRSIVTLREKTAGDSGSAPAGELPADDASPPPS